RERTPAIPEQRKEKLREIARFIRDCFKTGQPAKLIFICTHNSRRSQLSQIWATTMAEYLGLEDIELFSAGTEVTAFNPRAIAAIERAGFEVENQGGANPHYKVFVGKGTEEITCYSKIIDATSNPRENFAAIMTCSEADDICPFVPGALVRFSVPYTDPKESDGTDQEAQIYDRRCKQIATEMYYLFSQVH